jgi:ADP-heptose:LPS heptosyltransferase
MSDLVKLRYVQFLLIFKNGLLGLFAKILFQRRERFLKILVFRTGSIGDNICALPAVVAIRRHFTGAEIHILTTAGLQSPVSMSRLLSEEYYDKLIDYEGYSRRELFKHVRGNRYDLVIELPQNMVQFWPMIRNMLFFRLAGIKSGWGWEVSTIFSFRQVQERLVRFPSETERLLNILLKNGVMIKPERAYPLRITKKDIDSVEELMALKRVENPTRNSMIALVPGAKRPQNRYPLERYIELARWLVSRGYSVLVVGGADDVGRGLKLEEVEGVYSFAGLLSPIESAVLLSRCHYAISNDTGPMHLAYAVGTPVLAIFSARDFPNKWFPPPGKSKTLRNYDIHCSLCFSETCADNICMKGISLDEVKAAFVEFEKSTR